MTTLVPGQVLPVGSAYQTGGTYNGTPFAGAGYSGTFIPTLWSAKLNAKFYAASTFADICNRDWEGDVSNLGDKVVINNIPDIAIANYTVGGNLSYQTPKPNALELTIDKAKYFAFNISDVLDYQAKPNLMDMFSNDASQQLRVAIDSTCLFNTYANGASANRGNSAGIKSGSFTLGTEGTPVVCASSALGATVLLNTILQMASALDEQNVPDTGRYLVLDPFNRTLLMQSNLAQAQFMGDSTSIVRNGLIGTIDRFKVYVSNQLPKKVINNSTWTSGDGTETTTGTTYAASATRIMIAGHTSAIAFASQITKTEQVRNPTDFGDLVRGLQVYGYKVVKPESLAMAIITSA